MVESERVPFLGETFGGETKMVSEGKGRLFRRTDGKYLIYLPVSLAEDSMFPFKNWEENQRTGEKNSVRVKVSFKSGGEDKLLVEKWKEAIEWE